MMSADEESAFRLIVENAMAEGWLARGDALSATPAGEQVRVQCTRGNEAHEKTYAHTNRWLYEFLRDLAHGLWKVERFKLPKGTRLH
jgi:hypothetical protein